MSTVGNNILNRRKGLGMTQEELAKRMGYKSKSTINKIELGINDIPQSKIVKFAEVLGTTPAQLMGWENDNSMWSKEIFARNLQYYMDKSGKNQKEMAQIVGVSASAFNDWVKCKKYPRIDKIEMLANYFGILKSDLIEDKEKNISTDEMHLTDGEKALLDLFNQVPAESQQMVLEMIRIALKKK